MSRGRDEAEPRVCPPSWPGPRRTPVDRPLGHRLQSTPDPAFTAKPRCPSDQPLPVPGVTWPVTRTPDNLRWKFGVSYMNSTYEADANCGVPPLSSKGWLRVGGCPWNTPLWTHTCSVPERPPVIQIHADGFSQITKYLILVVDGSRSSECPESDARVLPSPVTAGDRPAHFFQNVALFVVLLCVLCAQMLICFSATSIPLPNSSPKFLLRYY